MHAFSIAKMRLARRALLAVPLALGVVAVTLADQSTPAAQDTSTVASPTSFPSSTPVTHVTVNGQTVPVDASGSAHVSPSAGTNVDVSGGKTAVTSSNQAGSVSNANTGNTNIAVNSSSNNGTSWSSTQTTGGDAAGNSTSFSSTTVFSTGSSYTHVSEP